MNMSYGDGEKTNKLRTLEIMYIIGAMLGAVVGGVIGYIGYYSGST